MTDAVAAALETELTTEVARMYQQVATNPDGDFHFYTGRTAAAMYGYRPCRPRPDSARRRCRLRRRGVSDRACTVPAR